MPIPVSLSGLQPAPVDPRQPQQIHLYHSSCICGSGSFMGGGQKDYKSQNIRMSIVEQIRSNFLNKRFCVCVCPPTECFPNYFKAFCVLNDGCCSIIYKLILYGVTGVQFSLNYPVTLTVLFALLL